MTLVERIVALHEALERAGVPHAFGGALALAWCTQQARATVDIDINLFVAVADAEGALLALPDGVTITDADRGAIAADGQTRLWWEGTPVDVFSTRPRSMPRRVSAPASSSSGVDVPFLACRDLAVFKALFGRTRDWADLEEMAAADTLAIEDVLGVLARYLGGGDPRVTRLRSLG